jgi:hypothetical protein
MRRRLASFVIVCLAGFAGSSALRAADVEFLRLWPGWRDAESFDRISEYFSPAENQGRQVILRTRPDVRDGYYFLARVKSAVALAGAKFDLHVIHPNTPEAKTYTFPAAVPAKETVFQLGLTGPDWPAGPKANPIAWKIALIGADGRVLAEHKSFLWEKPAK